MRGVLSIILLSIYISTFGIEKAFASSSNDSYIDDESSESYVKNRKDTAYFQYHNRNKLPIVKNDISVVKNKIPRKRKKEIIENFEEEHLQKQPKNNKVKPKSKKIHVIRSKNEIKEERKFFSQIIEKFFENNTEMKLCLEMPKLMASFKDGKDNRKYKAKILNFRRFIQKLTNTKDALYDNRYILEKRGQPFYLMLNNKENNISTHNNIIESLDDIQNNALNSEDETEEENEPEFLNGNKIVENEIKENEIVENKAENKEKSPEISFESSNDNSIQISTENNANSDSIQSDSIEIKGKIINILQIQPDMSHLTLTEITKKINQKWKLKNENDKTGEELIKKYNYILTNMYNIITNSNKLNTAQSSLSELQKYVEKLEIHLPNHFDKIEKKPEETIFIDLTDDK